MDVAPDPLGRGHCGRWLFSFWPRCGSPSTWRKAVRAPLMTGSSDDGTTRVREVYVLSAPYCREAAACRQRTRATSIAAGKTVVATLEPADPAFLDARSQRQLEFTVSAARAARDLALASRAWHARRNGSSRPGELDRARATAGEGRRVAGPASTRPKPALSAAEAGARHGPGRAAPARIRDQDRAGGPHQPVGPGGDRRVRGAASSCARRWTDSCCAVLAGKRKRRAAGPADRGGGRPGQASRS
jgi:hypothetical protein